MLAKIEKNKMLVINKNKKKNKKNKIRTKIIKLLILFPNNDAKFDNAIVDNIKLILLNYNNFNIAKIVANNIESVISMNKKLISNKLVLMKSIH